MEETSRLQRQVAEVQAQLQREREFRQAVIKSLPGIYFVFDEAGRFLQWNQNLLDLTGRSAEDMASLHPVSLVDASDRPLVVDAIQHVFKSGQVKVEAKLLARRGERLSYLLSGTAAQLDGQPVVIGHGVEISDLKEAEEKIVKLAFYDQLTGLPNRALLTDRLRQAMTSGVRDGNHGALLLIDVDNFKTLNDTLGHDMGDALLNQVAARLCSCVRAQDTVARLGGDEFVLMLAGLGAVEAEAAALAEVLGARALEALNKPYCLDDVTYRCTSSIGATMFRGHLATVEDVLKQADLAMYKAKATGRNTMRFFDPNMESAVMARAALELDLQKAVQHQQFLLHYQPQVVGNGRVTGAEVLVRWKHPQRGMVSPAEFIPLAEDTGLILQLGEWVLETACAQLADWAGRPGLADLAVAVNVSARQFRQEDFVDQVLAVLDRTKANPRRLKLELTESMLAENVEEIITKMVALEAKGVDFSLDDFGTGYSSLSYLKRLPLHQLKIDQSFVRDVLTDANDAAIARTIVALARSLGMGVIAEGVETAEQKDFLAGSGCHAYQGYFFSRPLPVEDFEKFVLGG